MKRKGWTCLTNMAYGQDLVWQHQETPESEVMPDIYDTLLEAQKEMVDEVRDHLDQFIDGERDFDAIVWPQDEYEVVMIEIDDNNTITCWNLAGDVVWERSLEAWKQGL